MSTPIPELENTSPLLEAALGYAEGGLPVFPVHYIDGGGRCSCGKADCDSPGKHPMTKNGFKDATTDPKQIKQWWTKTPDANIGIQTGKRSGLLVIDSDEKSGVSGRRSIREAGLNMPDTWVVQTPSGGLHYYYQYPEGQEIRCRTNVLPGVDIRGDGGYVVAPPSVIDGKPYTLAVNAEITPLPSPWVGVLTKRQYRDVQVDSGPIMDGTRNGTLCRFAARMRYFGLSPSEIEAALLTMDNERCEPPVGPKKVATIAEWAGNHPIGDYSSFVDLSNFKPPPIGAPAPVSDHKYDIRRYDGVEPPPPDWQVKGLIECRTLVELFGGWGEGKTFVVLDLLACIATGRDYHGRPVTQGPVVYFCGEGQRGLNRRLRAWEMENDIKLPNYPFYICTTPAALCEEGDAQAVIDAICATGETPVHVCLDTRSRNFGAGDENGGVDMGTFLKACDAIKETFGCTVLATHHPGHMEKGRGRGHSSWLGALDVSYRVKKTLCGKVSVTVAKAPKDFESPEPFAFQLTQVDLGITDEDGKPVTSCVLRPLDGALTVSMKPQGSAQREMFDILKRLAQEASPAEGIDLGLVPASDWKAACIEAGRTLNTFYSVRKKLIEKKLIFEVGDSFRVNE